MSADDGRGPGGARRAAAEGGPDRAAALSAHVVVRRARFAVDVTLDVAAGERLAIMGPSGAGKTTLVEAIAGLTPLDGGEVVVGGRVVDRVARPRVRVAPMHRGVVLLGQDPRLFPHLSVGENVAFGPRAAGLARTRALADAERWLARVGLPGTGSRRPGELSGGEQQRVAVARALAAAPRMVLLDEPLVALDPETASAIREMLREQLAGVTTVAVTHDAVDAVALADRLLVVERGRMRQDGAVREVLAAPASGFVASIGGLVRVEGVAEAGAWQGHGVRLDSSDPASRECARASGAPLAAVFRPGDVRVVAIGAGRLDGGGGAGPVGGAGVESDAGGWEAVVTRREPTPAGVRVHAGWCAVDVPVAMAADLAPGTAVRLRVAPEDVRFVAAPAAPAAPADIR
jgi:molybdate transport system ATP-binding protein